jgi:hypothetical protein
MQKGMFLKHMPPQITPSSNASRSTFLHSTLHKPSAIPFKGKLIKVTIAGVKLFRLVDI